MFKTVTEKVTKDSILIHIVTNDTIKIKKVNKTSCVIYSGGTIHNDVLDSGKYEVITKVELLLKVRESLKKIDELNDALSYSFSCASSKDVTKKYIVLDTKAWEMALSRAISKVCNLKQSLKY